MLGTMIWRREYKYLDKWTISKFEEEISIYSNALISYGNIKWFKNIITSWLSKCYPVLRNDQLQWHSSTIVSYLEDVRSLNYK